MMVKRNNSIFKALLFSLLVLATFPVLHAEDGSRTFEHCISKAEELEKARDYKGALTLYEEAILTARDGEEKRKALLGMAMCYRKQKLYDEAIEQFRNLLAIEGKSKSWYYDGFAQVHIGLSFKDKQEYEQAIEEFEKVGALSTTGVFKSRALLEIAYCLEALSQSPGISEKERNDYKKQAKQAYKRVLIETAEDGYPLYLRRAYEQVGPDDFGSREEYDVFRDELIDQLARNRRIKTQEDMEFLSRVISD